VRAHAERRFDSRSFILGTRKLKFAKEIANTDASMRGTATCAKGWSARQGRDEPDAPLRGGTRAARRARSELAGRRACGSPR
jgi:hypothetical protein